MLLPGSCGQSIIELIWIQVLPGRTVSQVLNRGHSLGKIILFVSRIETADSITALLYFFCIVRFLILIFHLVLFFFGKQISSHYITTYLV